MKILNFGSCNIDYVYSLDHIVKPGETQTSLKMEVFPGGKGLNQSIALAKAGVNAYHAGVLGNDGGMLFDILKENGVNTKHLKTADIKNGHAIIQVNSDGENSIFLYPGSNEAVDTDYIDFVLSDFQKDDLLLLQNEISNIDYIIRKAYEKGMTVILNPSPYNEKIEKLDFNMISYLILNEVEAEQITHFNETDKIIEFFNCHYPSLKIMLTLGKNGCVYADDKNKFYQDIFKVKAVDTTAAGDTFTGYFIAGIAEGEAIRDILKTASAASALAVSKKGAAPSIPEKEKVISFLKEN